jgi:selenocysteine lyase/cysteine desulfurase
MDFSTYRSTFPITAEYAFLNHASISPYSTHVTNAVAAHMQAMQTQPFDHFRDHLFKLVTRFKQQVAQLINAASPNEIVPMPNTAMGINTAAASLPLRPGDNVLVLDGDYPANIYPWLNLAPRGVLVKWVPQQNGGLDLDRLVVRIDGRTRVIALSSAMFATGFRNNLQSVGALCQERGIYFVVDAIQTLGAFSLDVQACHVDFLACGSQKWLLSAPGSGFLYCREGVLDELQLGAYVGAASTVDPFNFLDYNFTLQPSAERFSLGTPNILGMVALDASLALLHEAGISHIGEQVLALTDTLIDDLQARGYHILSNQESAHRSGIVIVEVPDPQAAYERLLAANVVTSVRGAGLRIAPHFYNTEADVLRVGEVLGDRTAA